MKPSSLKNFTKHCLLALVLFLWSESFAGTCSYLIVDEKYFASKSVEPLRDDIFSTSVGLEGADDIKSNHKLDLKAIQRDGFERASSSKKIILTRTQTFNVLPPEVRKTFPFSVGFCRESKEYSSCTEGLSYGEYYDIKTQQVPHLFSYYVSKDAQLEDFKFISFHFWAVHRFVKDTLNYALPSLDQKFSIDLSALNFSPYQGSKKINLPADIDFVVPAWAEEAVYTFRPDSLNFMDYAIDLKVIRMCDRP